MKNNILTNKILIMKKMNFIQKMFFMLACMMSLHAMTLNDTAYNSNQYCRKRSIM